MAFGLMGWGWRHLACFVYSMAGGRIGKWNDEKRYE
jgi:hypothetical protein